MKLIIKLNYKISLFLFLIIFSNSYSYANTEKTKEFILDKTNNTKKLLTLPNVAKKKVLNGLELINRECCESNFSKKEKINEIKINLQTCLEKKCHLFVLPIFTKKKPPLKLTVMKQLEELEDLLIINEELKYENLMSKLQNEKDEIKLKNEQNIDELKKRLLNLEKKNINLKKTVDKMLSNYQKKISKLKKENETLSENFNLVFNEHSKNKQKKLQEKLK